MKKELAPLEALNDLRNCLQAYYTMENVPSIDDNLNIIETALNELEIKREVIGDILTGNDENKFKALEIIKNKRVRVPYLLDLLETSFNGDVLEEYNSKCDELSQEEFDLLKEVLL